MKKNKLAKNADILKDYGYFLPPKLIAQKPCHPRDSARLLVYSQKSKKVKYNTFRNIGKYLPEKCVLVFNKTKVIPARLALYKPTGGKVEILYISHDKKYIKCLCNKKITMDTKLSLTSTTPIKIKGEGSELFTVSKKQNQFYFLKPNFPTRKIFTILNNDGQTPLPPYIKHSPLSEKQKREQYQSVFARQGLSVAAPTASLHFTKNLLSQLKKQGVKIEFITLNIGLGTFAPITIENLKNKTLHSEYFEISKHTLQKLNYFKKDGYKIIPVGTTSLRALESSADKYGKLKIHKNSTRLFIQPGYRFKFAHGIITNFHVPKSSLMMLVASIIGKKMLIKLYNLAILKKFRFFSFGDGMLITP